MLRLVSLLTVLSAPALAQEVDCANAVTQGEMNVCAKQDWQVADADLNRAYQQAMAVMKSVDANLPVSLQGAEASLRAAQRAWVAFRDANCAAWGVQMRGGTAEPLIVYTCLARMTRDRTVELLELSAL